MISNLPPFYVGETVEYITGILMPKGTKVTVKDIWKLSCGCWVITIFERHSEFFCNNVDNFFCYDCNRFVVASKTGEVGWYATSFRRIARLRPITFKQIKEIEVTEVLTLN